MRLILVFVFFYVAVGQEFNKYNDYLVFAAKHHYKSVAKYAEDIGFDDFHEERQWFRSHGHNINTEEEKFHLLRMMQFVKTHNDLYRKGDVTHQVYLRALRVKYFKEYDSLSKPKPKPLWDEYLELTVNSNKTIDRTVIVQNSSVNNFPDSFDWRHFGKVTPVKDQGECGSCYAFSIAAIIESAYLIKFNKTLDLSEQQMVDCDENESGCEGGWVGLGLEYVKNTGLESEKSYPYSEYKHRCSTQANDGYKSPHVISDYGAVVDATDEEMKQILLKYGPIAVYIDNTGLDFKLYDLGIVSKGDELNFLNHVVVIVGWGPGYWIAKNSWGTEWGERGYARIAMGGNVRGINSVVYFVSL